MFLYLGDEDPKRNLDKVIKFTYRDIPYYSFIDASLDNPYLRLVMTGLSKLKGEVFNENYPKLPELLNTLNN